MTSVGRFTRAMHCAIVNVLPDPVTPRSTCALSPRSSPSTSSSMARAWSPRSSKSDTSLNWSYLDAMASGVQTRPPEGTTIHDRTIGRGWRGRARHAGGGAQSAAGTLLVGPEIPGAGTKLGALRVRSFEPDLDLAPRAIGPQIRRVVPDAVAGGDLAQDVLVDLVELLDARGEEGLPSRERGHALELNPLLVLHRRGLVLQVADRIDRDV